MKRLDKIDLSGCTIEDRPLEKLIRGVEIFEEVGEILKEEIRDEKVMIRRSQKQRYTPAIRKVNSRVRYWTPDEIRKERGLMEKPYPSKVENILWCIKNVGDVSMADIAQWMEMPEGRKRSRELSGPLSTIWTYLGTEGIGAGMLNRVRVDRVLRYSCTYTYSVEDMYKVYLEKNREVARLRTAERKKGLKSGAADQAAPDTEFVSTPTVLKDTEQTARKDSDVSVLDVDVLTQRVLAAVKDRLSAEFEVNVNVSGRVEVLFGWKGRQNE